MGKGAHDSVADTLAEGLDCPGPRLASEGPQRRCILTGRHGDRALLIRLVEGPDGVVWPDLPARLPGRGAWVLADGALIAEAVAQGTLARALARAWRRPPPEVPADLATRIGTGLERRLLDRLGLEHRAGRLLLGSEKIAAAARAGRLALLLHAADAAEDGAARLDQAFRVGGAADWQESRGIFLPFGRERLSRALGRDNMVHVGITDGRTAARVARELTRLAAYMRWPDGQVPAGREQIELRPHQPTAARAVEDEDEGLE
ncbi:DUF448 domain-containing protein [Thermaurantiacus sp.]